MEPVLNEDGSLKNFTLTAGGKSFTLTVGGKSFRCACGCNVFHKPDDKRHEIYQCNACEQWYIGERE